MFRNRRIITTALLMAFVIAAKAQVKVKTVARQRVPVTADYEKSVKKEAEAVLAPYKHVVDSLMGPVMGHVGSNLVAQAPECNLGNFVADVLMWKAAKMKEKVDFSLMNMGGLRAPLNKGAVTIGDVLALSPFDNYFCVVDLKGDAVAELFENIAMTGGQCVSSSVRLVIKHTDSTDLTDSSNNKNLLNPLNLRAKTVKEVTIDGKPINPNRTYRIATIDFVAEGNDHMTALKKAVKIKVKKEKRNLLNQVICEYLQELEKKGQVADAQVEGRVTYETSPNPSSGGASEASPEGRLVRSITILHTNDTHSAVSPLSENLTDTAIAGRAGFLRRSAMIEAERGNDADLLLFDSGDFVQGSPYSSLFKGEAEVKLMSYMRYDAATLGNHEFDYGLENLARLMRMASFPVVNCNYDFTGTPIQDLIKPYIIIERKGLRIGVLGVTANVIGVVSAANIGNAKYLDPIKSAQKVVDTLRKKEKCDVVVCLSHLGWDLPLEDCDDKRLIQGTTGIDVVLGGHSHTYMEMLEYVPNAEGKVIPVDQNGKHGAFVGKLKLEVKTDPNGAKSK